MVTVQLSMGQLAAIKTLDCVERVEIAESLSSVDVEELEVVSDNRAYVVCILPSSSKVMNLDKAHEANETYIIKGKDIKRSFFKVSVI